MRGSVDHCENGSERERPQRATGCTHCSALRRWASYPPRHCRGFMVEQPGNGASVA